MSFSFNPDGSLAATKPPKRDHLAVLYAVAETPFGMGQKLLVDHLRGRRNAKTAKLRLDRYLSFGELAGYEEDELRRLLGHLEARGYLSITREKGKYPVYVLTPKGEEERARPQLSINLAELDRSVDEAVMVENPFTDTAPITAEDRKLFASLKGFFDRFNEEQKKAATCQEKRVLCVAGAGSGKTSVLTKRVEFLVKYRSVPPDKILAITFTRKARGEMQERLEKLLPEQPVRVETFNSYCEKALQAHGHRHYEAHVRMASFKEQLSIIVNLLKARGHTPQSIVEAYFTKRQRNGKDPKTLFFTFTYDFHTLLDKMRLTGTSSEELRKAIRKGEEHAPLAALLASMAEDYLAAMTARGLRDYTAQLLDAIALYTEHPELVPRYEHVLVDEYQDVNDQQVALLELLAPENLFAVGDPRQSIYGWRGSKVRHITGFGQKYPDATVILLTANYRSGKAIVEACNALARKTGYADLHAACSMQGSVGVHRHANEETQAITVTEAIKRHEGPRNEVFVLARTNKALETVKEHLEAHAIPYLLRTDELKRPGVEALPEQVTLATIHAIKGLEAKVVHVINANAANFPCKASDHPVMELFNLQEDYDSYAEELRVLYVALSRAKEALYIHYTGSLTTFLDQAQTLLSGQAPQKTKARPATNAAALMMRLREWRYALAKERGCPAYVICNDKTLQALCEHQPRELEDLYAIPGLGQARIEDYGEDLLHVLSTA